MISAHANKTLIGLVGAGGFGREVMPFVRLQIAELANGSSATEFEIVFVETSPSKGEIGGCKVRSEEDFFGATAGAKYFNIAIGSSVAREKEAGRYLTNGCRALALRAPSAIVYDENEIGEGSIICDNCIVTSNVSIGRYFHANIFSYVAHDCEIGDFVTLAPRVSCNGNVKIGDHAYIGTGAVIREGKVGEPLVIGEGAIVGMGAVVTKHVPPHTTVVGNPAKPLIKSAQ